MPHTQRGGGGQILINRRGRCGMLLSAPSWSCPKCAVTGTKVLGRPAGSGEGCKARCRCHQGVWHRAGKERATTQRSTSLLFEMPLFRSGISQSNPKAPAPKFWGQRTRQVGSTHQPPRRGRASPGTRWAATISMMGTVPGTVPWGGGCPPARSILGIVADSSLAVRRRQGDPKTSCGGGQKPGWMVQGGEIGFALSKCDGEGAERHPLLQEQGLSLHQS